MGPPIVMRDLLCYNCKKNNIDRDRGGCTLCGAPYLKSKDPELNNKSRVTVS